MRRNRGRNTFNQRDLTTSGNVDDRNVPVYYGRSGNTLVASPVTIDEAGNIETPGATISSTSITDSIRLDDNEKIYFGDNAEMSMYYDGSNFKCYMPYVSGSGHFSTFDIQGDGVMVNLMAQSGAISCYLLPEGIIGVKDAGYYKIGNNTVLSQTTLGSTVVYSSLTTLGTLSNLRVDNLMLDANTLSSVTGYLYLSADSGYILPTNSEKLGNAGSRFAEVHATTLYMYGGSVGGLMTLNESYQIASSNDVVYTSATRTLSITNGVFSGQTGSFTEKIVINGADTLTATTLGSSVVNSSLTSVGTLTSLQVDNVKIDANVVTSTQSHLYLYAGDTTYIYNTYVRTMIPYHVANPLYNTINLGQSDIPFNNAYVTSAYITNTYTVLSANYLLTCGSDVSGFRKIVSSQIAIDGSDPTILHTGGLYDSSLTSGQVLYTGTSGRLTNSSSFTYDNDLGKLSAPTLSCYFLQTLDLYSGRVPYVNSDQKLDDSSSFTFDISTRTLAVDNANVDSLVARVFSVTNLITAIDDTQILYSAGGEILGSASLTYNSATGKLTATSLCATGLTTNRVVLSNSGTLSTGNLSFASDVLTTPDIIVSNVTASKFAYFDSNKKLTTADLSYDAGTSTLTVATLAATTVSASTYSSSITSGQILFSASGNFTGNTSLTYNSGTSTLATTNINVTTANITTINATTISGSLTNGKLLYSNNGTIAATTLTYDVSGNFTAASLTSSSLTSGRVVYTSTSGLLTASAGMTYDGTTLGVAALNVSGLLTDSIPFVGASSLSTSNLLTYNNTTHTLTTTVLSATTISATTANVTTVNATNLTASALTNGKLVYSSSGTLATLSALSTDGSGNVTANGLTLSSMTSGRVVYTSTSGLLTSTAGLTYDGTTLSATALTATGLTTNRVLYANSGALTSSSMTYTSATNTLTLTNIATTNISASGISSDALLYNNGTNIVAGPSYNSGTNTLTANISATSLSATTTTTSTLTSTSSLTISSSTNGDITIAPNGTGKINTKTLLPSTTCDIGSSSSRYDKAYFTNAYASTLSVASTLSGTFISKTPELYVAGAIRAFGVAADASPTPAVYVAETSIGIGLSNGTSTDANKYLRSGITISMKPDSGGSTLPYYTTEAWKVAWEIDSWNNGAGNSTTSSMQNQYFYTYDISTGNLFTSMRLWRYGLFLPQFSSTSGLSTANGQMIYDTTANAIKYYDSSAFTTLVASTSLTSTRVPFCSSGSTLDTVSTFTYNSGTSTLSATNVSATTVTATNFTSSALTNTYVLFSNSGTLTTHSGLTYNSGTSTLSATNISSTSINATNLTASALTNGKLVYSSSGTLATLSALSTDGSGNVTANGLTLSSMTSGRVVYTSTSGLLTSTANFTITNVSGTDQFNAPYVSASSVFTNNLLSASSVSMLVSDGSNNNTLSGASLTLSTTSNGNISLSPNGTGKIMIAGTVSAGTNTDITIAPNGTGKLILTDSGAASGVSCVEFNSSTRAIKLPSLTTTAQGNITPVAGQFMYNSTTAAVTYYNGYRWVNMNYVPTLIKLLYVEQAYADRTSGSSTSFTAGGNWTCDNGSGGTGNMAIYDANDGGIVLQIASGSNNLNSFITYNFGTSLSSGLYRLTTRIMRATDRGIVEISINGTTLGTNIDGNVSVDTGGTSPMTIVDMYYEFQNTGSTAFIAKWKVVGASNVAHIYYMLLADSFVLYRIN